MDNYIGYGIEKPKILIVDDDERQLVSLERILLKTDIEIHKAISGQEALTLLLNHHYLLVFLDVIMPEMNGLEVAQIMRENKLTQNVPIIFMTAYSKDELEVLKGYKLGAIDYINKPINDEIILSKVNILISFYKYEREKDNIKILQKLKEQNLHLEASKIAALNMLEDANEAQRIANEAQEKLKMQTEKLIQSEKMNAIGTLVAGVAHELNNPIMGILNYAAYCQKHIGESEKILPVLSDLIDEAERCSVIVKDLLSFTRKNDKKTQKNFKTDLLKGVKQSAKLLGVKILENDIKISFPEKKTSGTTNIDPNYLQQLLLNLLDNAIYAVEGVSEKEIKVDLFEDDKYNILVVKDNGVGISSENAKQIYNPFFTTKPVGKGTGLGLSICKNIVDEVDGSIEIKTQKGKGTTCIVNLPKNDNLIKQP